jgi:tetratricopeptide (TPR) repeat protein
MVALMRDGGGAAVPATIRALLDARIARLGAEERTVIQRAAVEGEVFHRAAVLALLDQGAGDGLQGRLAGLIRKEMIRPHAAVLPGQDAFRFRHLLIRDAAYDALPKHARAELHERFAAWLEVEATTLVELDEIAGWHLDQAIRFRRELGLDVPVELSSSAADHLAAAGRRAADRHDLRAADSLLTRALGLVDEGDERSAPLALALAAALIPAGEDERIPELLARAAADPRTGPKAQVGRVEWLMSVDPAESMRLVASALPGLQRDAEAAGDDRLLARIHKAYFFAEWLGSRAAPAAEALERAVMYADRGGDRALVNELRGWGAGPVMFGPANPREMERWAAATEQGEPSPVVAFGIELVRGVLATMEYRLDEARAHHEAADAILREVGFTLLLSASGQNTSRTALAAGDVAEAVRLLDESYELGRRLGDRSYHSTTAAQLAEALRRDGQLDAAEAMVGEAEEESAPEDVINFAITRATLALVAAARGDVDAALALAREAVGYAQLTDFAIHLADAQLALGVALRVAGRDAEAAEAFDRAIAIAEAKGDQPAADRMRAVAAGAPA